MPPRNSELFASIRHSPIATIITDPRRHDNPIVAVNDAFCRLTGYEPAEVIGRNCRFLAGPATERWSSRMLGDAIAAGRPTLIELLNYKKDGTLFRNAVMVAPCYDEDGKLEYFVGSQMEVGGTADLLSVLREKRARQMAQSLTPRQTEVLRHMMLGLRNKQIALRLSVSEKTVKMHRAALLAKLGARTSADAVRIAVEARL